MYHYLLAPIVTIEKIASVYLFLWKYLLFFPWLLLKSMVVCSFTMQAFFSLSCLSLVGLLVSVGWCLALFLNNYWPLSPTIISALFSFSPPMKFQLMMLNCLTLSLFSIFFWSLNATFWKVFSFQFPNSLFCWFWFAGNPIEFLIFVIMQDGARVGIQLWECKTQS